MKTANEIKEEKIDNLLNEVNGFFAFGQSQFDEAVEALKSYDITEKEVLKVYQDNININD